MGHDISPIGSHTLDVTDLKSLATDLHQRLNINIKYGAFISEDHAKLLDLDLRKDEGIYVLGKFIDDPSKPVYTLLDHYYDDKKLYEKFGAGIFQTEEYYVRDGKTFDEEGAESIVEDLNFMHYFLEYHGPDNFEMLNIYNHLYDNSLSKYSRWSGLLDYFENFKKLKHLGVFDEYRFNNARIAKKLGGKDLFYLDDQSLELPEIGMNAREHFWDLEQLKSYVRKKAGTALLDIPAFYTDKKYRHWFWKNNDYIHAAYDDFRDIV